MTILRFFSSSITGLIHVGAHRAQELEEYVDARIYSVIWIEANPSLIPFLEERIYPYSSTMFLANFAASDVYNSDDMLNLASNEQSSSLLSLGLHQVYHPDVTYIDAVPVIQRTIDSWISANNIHRNLYNAINIDVQGFELKALRGMKEQLTYIDLIECEINFLQTYDDCPLVHEIDQYLRNFGFRRLVTRKWGPCYGSGLYVRLLSFPRISFCLLSRLLRRTFGHR